MAGGKERTLRRRIKSVQATKKITKAMELIAATRVNKAQQRAYAARPYSEHITAVIQHLASSGASISHPLLREPDEVRRVAFVVITADRGLAGAYNSSVIRAAEREMHARRSEGVDYKLIVLGRKGINYFRFRGYDVEAAFTGMSDTPTFEHARTAATQIREVFEDGGVDEVILVYTRFLSIATQRVAVRQFLPLTGIGAEESTLKADYEFEPSPDGILAELLPSYVEARLFAAMLDGTASFFAAQQRAMKSATDNAEDLITRYTRAMNRARQDAITTEIMEIVGGAEAMRQAQSGEVDLLPDHALMLQNLMPEHLGEHHRRFAHTKK
jgi:F-type H+-transporting ATPase subunit gamma